jgi:hypothetical protein
MVSSASTYPSPYGAGGFEIKSGSYARSTPDVAWSSGGSTFLAVWTVDPTSGSDEISIRYLYDTYRSGLTQVYGSNAWQMAPYNSGADPLSSDCSAPAVAYDPVANAYIVVFEHYESF